jgi:hypothetical protein
MRKFVSGPISFLNAVAGLRCRVTRIRTGSKPGGNFFLNQAGGKATGFKHRIVNAMENAVSNLAQALKERLAIIHDEESRRDAVKHMARLSAVSEKIDKLQAALPRPIDPRLAHYLQRRSYDKALEFLEQL